MVAPLLPDLTLATAPPKDTNVLVVGIADSAVGAVLVGVPDAMEKAYASRVGTPLLDDARALGARTRIGTAVALPAGGVVLVVTGLGDVDVTPERIRRAAGSGVRTAAALAGDTPLAIAVSLETLQPDIVKGAAEGALLGAYAYARSPATPQKRAVRTLTLVASGRDARAAVELAGTIATAVCRARAWVDTPANILDPEAFAEEARVLAREAKIDLEVLDEKALARAGFGGILAVGGGSARPPRLVRLSYAPRGARFHLALVGKGITFDTGGVNLKPAEGMYTMKCDMAGAAAVLAAVRAIADLRLKIRVTAYAALAENMPSGTAYRPSDVLTLYGGKTVENANSDAEGRLVMADALVRAGEDGPDMIVDVATLTGACVVALGERIGGLMASDDQTADHILDAAEAAGEAFWQLPIPEDALESLSSDVADLRSAATSRNGGAILAAAFLRSFVPAGTPWAHLDIAGPAWNDKVAHDYVPKGATGAGVRTLVALARSLEG